VFTLDFITPIVDDAETFGAIAAANALSDVYAMGGEPQAALAICGFPTDQLPTEVLHLIFRGGREKAAEAGCAIVGGHTVKDAELKYGLCVIGSVDPTRILTQTRAQPGDVLVLTKPLGFGIASQAIKQQKLSDADIGRVVALMTTLNRDAKDAALAADAHAATDVTGFGLLGHVHHLLLGARAAARLYAGAVPVLDFAPPLAKDGFVPGGSKENLAYVDPHCHWAAVGDVDRLILCDAQTSGGLVIAVPPARVDALCSELERRNVPARAVIGEVVAGETGHIEVLAGR
jgi:selenide,water dikinase